MVDEAMAEADAQAAREVFYLAGGFYDGWRGSVVEALGLARDEYITPEQDNNQQAALTFVTDDLRAIDRCTAVIACLTPAHPCRGTAAEIGYAFAMGKPILLVMSDPVPELFLVAISQRLFTSTNALVEWVAGRRKLGLPVVVKHKRGGAP